MTPGDDTQAETANMTPMEKAVAGGYQEPEAPLHADRVNALVHDLQHAISHNAPVSKAMLDEVKDLLDYEEPADEAHSDDGRE